MVNNGGTRLKSFDYGLRSRLLLLLVVMLLPFIIFSAHQGYSGYIQLLHDKTTKNVRDAREVAGNVDELVQATGDLLVAISHSDAAQNQDYPALKKWFSGIAAKYPYYKNIIFVDLDGNMRAAARTYTKPDGKIIVTVKETAYYKRSIDADGFAYGDYMIGMLSKKPVIHITYPVFTKTGKRVGFVGISFDLARLQERIVTMNVAKGSEITVLGQNATIIARTLDPKHWIGKRFQPKIPGGTITSGMSITMPGPDGIVRYSSLYNTKRAPWLVAVCFEQSTLQKQALNVILQQLWFILPLLLVAVLGWLWIGRDVDGLYKTARRLGLADSLTGLGSFFKFNQDLTKDIALAKRHMRSLALLILDIQEFKRFNELNGYQYGNSALKQIAAIVSDDLRETDSGYRYGGDEISLLLTDTDELDAVEYAENLRKKIETAAFAKKDGSSANLTVAIGIAVFPVDASDVNSLTQSAIEALYEAKESTDTPIKTYSETARPSKAKAG